jgi:polyhydroxyalkanoate synthase subunit PhaC
MFISSFETPLSSSRLISRFVKLVAKTIDLKNITAPLLNIVGTEDDLVQAASSIPLNDLVSSTDNEIMQFPLGHVDLYISSYAHVSLWPKVAA